MGISTPGDGPESVRRLSRDLKAAAATLTTTEARYLVDQYYTMQDTRIRAALQVRDMEKIDEPHEVVVWIRDQGGVLERAVARALGVYAAANPVGALSHSIVGIGPVLSAGLLAHIDITRAPTVGHIWRFAGLDPTVTWAKKQKRPWNARLKTLCWKIGESFVKVSSRPDDVYGKIYAARKLLEVERNDAGLFADQAAASLEGKKWRGDSATKQCYEAGRLPPARLHLRAERYAVKLFLSHWHHVAHEVHFGRPPVKPYVLDHIPGHTHAIGVPHWP